MARLRRVRRQTIQFAPLSQQKTRERVPHGGGGATCTAAMPSGTPSPLQRVRAIALRRVCIRPPCASIPSGPSQEELMPEIVFYAISGRSVEQKRALVKDFTDAVVKNYKVDPSAVTITIVESPKEDKAKGGVLFSDMGAPKS